VIITTTDPITGEDLVNPETKPFIIEGQGHLAVKIYFESEETRRTYLNIKKENRGKDFRVSPETSGAKAGEYN
jgi:hypothetical protein